MKIYIQTNKATTNIFGLHTQPRKTSRYNNILKLVRGGGGGGEGGGGGRKKSQKLFLSTFWKILTKKNDFFWRALFKISIYGRPRRLYKNLNS